MDGAVAAGNANTNRQVRQEKTEDTKRQIPAALAGGKQVRSRGNDTLCKRDARLFPLRAVTGSAIAAAIAICALRAGMRERGAENAIQMQSKYINHRDTENTEKDTEGMGKGFMRVVTSFQMPVTSEIRDFGFQIVDRNDTIGGGTGIGSKDIGCQSVRC